MRVEVGGHVADGYQGVHDAFLANFAEQGEVGAGFTLFVDGVMVVDIYGGLTGLGSNERYSDETLQVVFSTTKGATAACASLLAQRGLLDFDAPVADYWPEFAQAGKQRIPVRWLLCHQAGLPTFDRRLTFDETLAWQPVIEALEVQSPYWEPGTRFGYHAITYGFLVGEVVRRITGTTMAEFWQTEFSRPLGLEFFMGLPAALESRVAPMIPAPAPVMSDEMRAAAAQSLLSRAITLNGAWPDLATAANTRKYHAAELGAAGGITSARSLARFYAGLIGPIDGGPDRALFTRETIDRAREPQSEGEDLVLSLSGTSVQTRFGLGFATTGPMQVYGGPRGFGHGGAGGSAGFADPDLGVAGGYVMNKMQNNITGDPRFRALLAAGMKAAGR
ncbi:MAG: serine hydrolase domain-containing protein [Acidimicrobiales bacterium]